MTTNEAYLWAKETYGKIGVDTEEAIRKLAEIPISIHCWQGDDVAGFENAQGTLSGGIQATGNYPGKARTPKELMYDFKKATEHIPGKKRINLHACYVIFKDGEKVDRDKIEPKHFEEWVKYAKDNDLGIDFNPTFFSHPKAADGLTLSHPNREIRDFWVDHAIACRRISAYIAKELGSPVLYNVWIPDGYKDIPADRLAPRLRLKESLDRIFEENLPQVINCVESKVFGIGVEAYTTGSNEFYMGYAGSRTQKDVFVLLDNGHYHPTEMVSDKIPSLLAFFDKVPLHVTRPVRWDSDHVVLLEDEIKEIAKEIVRSDALDRVLIGLDFFDASINRIAAWIVGARNMQKALLLAFLSPNEKLKTLQEEKKFTELMVVTEELKTYPFGAVWAKYCEEQGILPDEEWFLDVEKYEEDILLKR